MNVCRNVCGELNQSSVASTDRPIDWRGRQRYKKRREKVTGLMENRRFFRIKVMNGFDIHMDSIDYQTKGKNWWLASSLHSRLRKWSNENEHEEDELIKVHTHVGKEGSSDPDKWTYVDQEDFFYSSLVLVRANLHDKDNFITCQCVLIFSGCRTLSNINMNYKPAWQSIHTCPTSAFSFFIIVYVLWPICSTSRNLF